jgi:hypothetical protein
LIPVALREHSHQQAENPVERHRSGGWLGPTVALGYAQNLMASYLQQTGLLTGETETAPWFPLAAIVRGDLVDLAQMAVVGEIRVL